MDSNQNSTHNSAHSKRFQFTSKFMAIGISLLIIVAVVASVFGIRSWQQSKLFVPKDIKQQVTYTIFKPADTSNFVADKSTIKYDPKLKSLSYRAMQKGTASGLTFSFQEAPEVFADVPQAFSKFADDLHQYSSFDSIQGKVSLTKPPELQGGQSAVMNAKGTLMFIKPDKNLSDSDWKQLFSNMDVVK
jgi:hypothetical protein